MSTIPSDVGRNDPCPCGSGKKYKHCCLALDRAVRQMQAVAASPSQDAESVNAQIRQIRTQLIPRLPEERVQEVETIIEQLELLSAYLSMGDRIEKAGEQLSAHEFEYRQMMRDPAATTERALALFAEDPFADLRYTVEDLNRAFEEIGPLRPYAAPDEVMDYLMDASVYLAGDLPERQRVAQRLLMTLPDYVAEGRYLDGWLIQMSAWRLVEVPDEGNLFSFATAYLVYEAWQDALDEQREGLLSLLGVEDEDLAGLDVEEVDALVRARLADEGRKAALEAELEADPVLLETLQSATWQVELESTQLLEREDAVVLYIPWEEADAWVTLLSERLAPLTEELQVLRARGESPDPEMMSRGRTILLDTAQEMASALFTPERVQALVADLQDYGRKLLAKGEERAARLVHEAWMPLAGRGEDLDPTSAPLLVGLCYRSLGYWMATVADVAKSEDVADGEGASPAKD